jgi:hypothetical protein
MENGDGVRPSTASLDYYYMIQFSFQNGPAEFPAGVSLGSPE